LIRKALVCVQNPCFDRVVMLAAHSRVALALVTSQDENDFLWSAKDEPHASRRKAIMVRRPVTVVPLCSGWLNFRGVLSC
jgi:hypothetical protein